MSEQPNHTIRLGDRVRRLGPGSDGAIGTVVEIATRPSRATQGGQRQTVEVRIRVQWPAAPQEQRHEGWSNRTGLPRRTWLALSGQGVRWELAS